MTQSKVLKVLPSNWVSNMEELRAKYNVSLDDEVVKRYNIEEFKKEVKTKIISHAFDEVMKECKEKEKICRMEYNEIKQQDYLTKLKPRNAAICLRIRSKMLDIADDRPYLFEDGSKTQCRHCKMYEENLNHVVNCYVVSSEFVVVEEEAMYKEGNVDDLNKIAMKVKKFLDEEVYTRK